MTARPTAPPVTREMLAAPTTTPNGGPRSAPVARILVRPARAGNADDLAGIQHVAKVCGLMLGLDHNDWSPIVLVAERAGQIIGVVQALPAKPAAIVTVLGVLPEFRGSRAGYDLIKGAELALRLVGCRAWVAYARMDLEEWQATIKKWGAHESELPLYEYVKAL